MKNTIHRLLSCLLIVAVTATSVFLSAFPAFAQVTDPVDDALKGNEAEPAPEPEELIALRTPYNKTWRIADASRPSGYRYYVQSSVEKVHYATANGYRKVDNRIIPYSHDGYAYRNAANYFTVYFGKNVQEGFRYTGNGLYVRIGSITIGTETVPQLLPAIQSPTLTYSLISICAT